MFDINQQRAYHKAQLYRLLIRLLDNQKIASNIFFKGGTCSSMLGFLDRFSVDLDFDLKKGADKKELREQMHSIFEDLDLTIKDESQKALQFFLKYQSPSDQRNTIKLEIIDNPFTSIDHKAQYLKDIDRTAICQTLESIFANKLIALTDRHKKEGTVAGRDVYDIHYFLSRGFDYKKEIIEQRTKKSTLSYLKELRSFIDKKVTEKVINQDLNFLLPYKRFNSIRKTLKTETLMLLKDEIKRISEETI
ncbi:nucleotidyl transferase AbiEii/AbiGii toxin family protein [Patescibacteria group bacterium]|nr:nucleotidyl transferase AbiEii/AbiGii toxin family protein [Patescibacteria group bacterium]MBU4022872.1 nucleotidyl transferase AbiEii/AbiGii toxin family protein [Patescibacteria group bacterium]MBU4078118.1 nucleotidyl transferase AbiEii/AbiGii toxin family protein [Patescibacteria group bacterium]